MGGRPVRGVTEPHTGETCRITMNKDKGVSAIFAKQCTVTGKPNDKALGTVSGSATVDCGDDVEFTATPTEGEARVESWSGCTSVSDDKKTCTVTTSASSPSLTVTASFVAQCSLVFSAGSGGTVSGSGTIDCGGTLEATADDGYCATGWTPLFNDAASGESSCQSTWPLSITTTAGQPETYIYSANFWDWMDGMLLAWRGQVDRDSNISGFRIFAALAEHGIASLRFDDRGVGGSTGDTLQATVHDRAGDVEAAVGLLRSRGDIDAGSIGLIGHSEGGLVAPLVANRTDSVAFLVLLAAPAVPGGDLLLVQLRTILEMNGTAEEEIEQALAQQRLVLLAAATGQGWDEVEASLQASAREQLEALPQEARDSISDEGAYVSAIVTQQMASARSPWFRSLVAYDPEPAIGALGVPVLALLGALDVQVSADVNSAAFLAVAAESNIPDHTLVTFAAANHSFQEARTGQVAEFAQLKPEFAPEFLETLLTWLADQVS